MTNKPTLVGEIGLDTILDRIAFTEEGVQGAVFDQAKLFMAAATFRIKKMKKRQEAEINLDELTTACSLKIRAKNLANGKKGVTEKYLSDLVDGNEEVKKARRTVAETKALEEYSKLILETYNHRRDALKILAQFAFMEDNFRAGQGQFERMAEKRRRLKEQLPDKEMEDV